MTRKYRVQYYCLISAGLICLSAFYCHPKWTNRIINSGPITEMARAHIYPGKHHYVYPQINRHHKVPPWYRAYSPLSDILLPSHWFNSSTAILLGALGKFGCMVVQYSKIWVASSFSKWNLCGSQN